MKSGLLVLLLIGGWFAEVPEIDVSPAATDFVSTPKALADALRAPITAQWKHIPLRRVIQRIVSVTHVPILLDRRIDPDREVSAEARDELLLPLVNRLANEQGGEAKQIGTVIYVGPQRSASLLRTIIALRRNDLLQGTMNRTRIQSLSEHQTIAWGDLARPADVVTQAARKFDLKIESLDKVPHDLWSRNALPQLGAIEMLSLLLVQYDLTFEWNADGRSIRIIALAEKIALTKSYPPISGRNANQTRDEWQRKFPDLAIDVRENLLKVSGTVEQHEALSGTKPSAPSAGATRPPAAADLSRTRFTLKVAEVPLSRLIQQLESPVGGELRFDYDEQALKASGQSLEQRISFDVKGVPMQELLRQALRETGIAFELKGRSVRLFPAKKR